MGTDNLIRKQRGESSPLGFCYEVKIKGRERWLSKVESRGRQDMKEYHPKRGCDAEEG